MLFRSGETSAAVLDCMNHGLATIVNANGSMADIPKSCVHFLTDNFEVKKLVIALEKLYFDENYRLKLSEAAQKHIHKSHSPAFCAKRYMESIESSYANIGNSLSKLDRKSVV